MTTKLCQSCRQLKLRDDFYRNVASADGYHSYCRECYEARYRRTPQGRARNKASTQKRRRNPKLKLAGYFANDVSKMLRAAIRLKKIGYTCEALIQHLEGQFEPGMTWDNYGSEWTIDHILPVSSPNFAFQSCDDPDFARCWALSNLRPFNARKNREKGSKTPAQLKMAEALRRLKAL